VQFVAQVGVSIDLDEGQPPEVTPEVGVARGRLHQRRQDAVLAPEDDGKLLAIEPRGCIVPDGVQLLPESGGIRAPSHGGVDTEPAGQIIRQQGVVQLDLRAGFDARCRTLLGPLSPTGSHLEGHRENYYVPRS
jgi:hypothetical protein